MAGITYTDDGRRVARVAQDKDKTEAGDGGGSSLERMLAILDLFDDDSMVVTADDVARAFDCSRATAYRYLKCLAGSGLLSASYQEGYGVGPRVVELDRLLRLHDPLVGVARAIMHETSGATGLNLMLCGFYRDKVMCLHTEWSNPAVHSSYERGRPMPMFLGATAKAILAHLTPYQQRNLMLRKGDEIRDAGLGDGWDAFRANLLRLRREEVIVTYGEIDPGLVGVGAPVFASERRVAGSLVAIVAGDDAQGAALQTIRATVGGAARRISDLLSAESTPK